MKRSLFLFFVAMACGTLAFAQTDGTYTGNLHVEVSGSESDVKDSKVTVAWDTENTSQLDFTLHDFAISIGSVSLDLGDITIKKVDVDTANEVDGVATFSCTEDHKVELDGTVSLLVSSISVNMTGTISDDELYASMTIDVTVLLVGSYNITATFVTSGYGLNGDYLIIDVESGYYLAGGLFWGTQAMEGGRPQFFTLEMQSDGAYTLDSHQSNGGDNHYLGTGLYCDAESAHWTFDEVEGGYTIYNSSAGYLKGNGFQTAITGTTNQNEATVWKLVTKDDIIADMANASVDNPVDVTALIKAPELKRNSNTDYYKTWTVTGYDGTGTPSNYAFGSGQEVANCAESYHSTNGFNFSQEITLPKAGYYTLSAKGFWREDDGSTDLSRPVLYAGDATSTFPQISRTDEFLGQKDNMVNAYQEFLLGLHQIDAIPITAAQDGETITIGFKGDDTSLWHIMGELELLYYADAPAHECTADIDHWSIAPETPTKGDFHQNTWSTEADASDLTTPFLEYWVYGTTLSAATISHETIENLDPGVYEVSLTIRIFSEAGNAIGTGTTFNANGVSEDVASGSDSNEDIFGTEVGVYGTYTLTCTVGEDGKLDISIVIPEGVTYNWISFKDLKVVYISGPIEWTLGASYGTLILPFDYDLSADTNTSGLTAYTVASITDATGDESATLNLSTGTTSIAANTPYIMSGTEGTYTFIGIPTNTADSYTEGYLTGYMVADYAPANSYVLQLQDTEPAFYLVESESEITVGAYHCYLNYPATPAGAKLVVYFPDSGVATAIDAVETTEETADSETIYDLSGRRVAKAQKGVYIVNGKKKVIK